MMKKSAQRIQVWLIFAMVLVLGCIPLVAHAAVITCPAGYQCMAETAAAAQWGQGQYVKYSSGVCGTDIDMTVYYYCFKQKPVTTTITTTPVTTIPQVSCPAGSECMLDSKAKSTWGQGNYEPYSSAVCGTGPVSSPYGGMEFCYGPKRVTNAPIPVKSLITPSGSVQVCAHIPCEPPKVLYCPDKCPGGCGVVCVIPKELPKPPSPETSFVFSGIVDEWRFDTGQDMSREAPRYMQRVNNETVMLYGSYYSTGYDVGDYIASGTTTYNGEYSIALGPNMPQRNYTYYFLSPDGAFDGRPWVRFDAKTLGGNTVPGRYGKVIYYTAPLAGKTGGGNDFMFYTWNGTGPNPSTVIVNRTPVYPGIIVTPPEMVQQTPNFNMIGIFSPVQDLINGIIALFSPAAARSAATLSNAQEPVPVPTHLASCKGNTVDLDSDQYNCGSCGNLCGNLTCCEGTCTITAFDSQNCGKCGHVCEFGTCIAGQCSASDEPGGGSLYCDAGKTACGNHCANILTDNQNCGSCGNDCGSSGRCCNGKCICDVCACEGETETVLCPQDQTHCFGSYCADLTIDSANCGSCGIKCRTGESCVSGVCMWTAGRR